MRVDRRRYHVIATIHGKVIDFETEANGVADLEHWLKKFATRWELSHIPTEGEPEGGEQG